jgi:hypothetical protein
MEEGLAGRSAMVMIEGGAALSATVPVVQSSFWDAFWPQLIAGLLATSVPNGGQA